MDAEAEISFDCDAYSVIVTYGQMSSSDDVKSKLREFLLQFGSNLSCMSIPHGNLGSNKVSGVFGCSKDNPCQHLPKDYQSNEMIVLQCPVKLAVPKESKQKIIQYLQDRKYHMVPSPNDSICFDSKSTCNTPPYDVIVDAVIDVCGGYFHVANYGMRHKIVSGSMGPTEKLFIEIQKLRDNQFIKVDIAQLDIAVNIPYPKGSVIQMHCTNNNHPERCEDCNAVFSKAEMEIYPMHSYKVSMNADDRKTPRIVPKEQSGTVKVEYGKNWGDDHPWEVSNNDIISIYLANDWKENNKDDISEDMCGDVQMNSNNFHNFKAYSNLSHSLMQIRAKLPLSFFEMNNIENKNAKALKLLLHTLETFTIFSLNAAKKCGVNARLEVSIRPKDDEDLELSRLRRSGHLVDFLAHACIGLEDCLGGTFVLKVKSPSKDSNIDVLQTRLQIIILHIKSYIRIRNSHRFNEVWIHMKYHVWLRAMISLAMTIAGYAPSFRSKYISAWLNFNRLNSPSFHDPYNMVHHLQSPEMSQSSVSKKLAYEKTEKYQNDDWYNEVQYKTGLTKEGKEIMKQYMKDMNLKRYCGINNGIDKRETMLEIFRRLNGSDKLIMMRMPSLIPNLFDPTNNDRQEINITSPIETSSSQEEDNFFVDYEHERDHQLSEEEETALVIKFDCGTDVAPPNHDCMDSTIQSLTYFRNNLFRNPMDRSFINMLRRHISNCHETGIKIKSDLQLSSLKESTIDSERHAHQMLTKEYSNHSPIYSYQDLKMLCRILSVKPTICKDGGMTKQRYIQCLCMHYSFPCDVTNYERDTLFFHSDEINNSINNSILHEIRSSNNNNNNDGNISNAIDLIPHQSKRRRRSVFDMDRRNWSLLNSLQAFPEGVLKHLPKKDRNVINNSGYMCLIKIMIQHGINCENVTTETLRHQLATCVDQSNLCEFKETGDHNSTFEKITKEEIIEKLLSVNEEMDYKIICPIFVKCFRISLSVWMYHHSQGSKTEFYEYIQHSNVVIHHKIQKGYIHVHTPNKFQYIQLSTHKDCKMMYSWYEKANVP